MTVITQPMDFPWRPLEPMRGGLVRQHQGRLVSVGQDIPRLNRVEQVALGASKERAAHFNIDFMMRFPARFIKTEEAQDRVGLQAIQRSFDRPRILAIPKPIQRLDLAAPPVPIEIPNRQMEPSIGIHPHAIRRKDNHVRPVNPVPAPVVHHPVAIRESESRRRGQSELAIIESGGTAPVGDLGVGYLQEIQDKRGIRRVPRGASGG